MTKTPHRTARSVLRSTLAAAALFAAPAAFACDVPQPARATSVAVISNSFPVLQFLGEEMRSCTKGNLTVETRLTPEHTQQMRVALGAGGASPFAVLQVSNGTFTEFVNRGWLQPITDLVRKHWTKYNFADIPQALWDQASFEGEIYAIPFQSNAPVLFYRKDLFDKHGIAVPKTVAEMLAAARTLKEKEPGLEFPIAQPTGRGWNLATEFGNFYQSAGGTWLDAKGMPTFNDAAGIKAIETLQAMLPLMSPNALALGSDDVMVAFQQGKAAMGIFWASRAASMDDPAVSRVVGQVAFAPAPSLEPGGKPSAAFWWDGYVLPKNLGSVDRETAFLVIAEANDSESYAKRPGLAYFARSSAVSDPALIAKNRFWPAMTATVQAGATVFPPRASFNLAHTQVGSVLPDALQGRGTAKEALDKAAASYVREARAQGLLN